MPSNDHQAPPELVQLAAIRDAKRELATLQDAAVAQARAADHSWTDIGSALGVPRQVAHARYSNTIRGWQAVTAPELEASGVTGNVHIDGRNGTATVHARMTQGVAPDQALAYNPVTNTWTGQDDVNVVVAGLLTPEACKSAFDCGHGCGPLWCDSAPGNT